MGFGVVLLLVGVIWMLQTFGIVDSSIWQLMLPLVLMYFGFVLIGKSDRSNCWVCSTVSKKRSTKKKK